ncbi:MAG: PaaI family thioesterase [Siphonobacter sp.]
MQPIDLFKARIGTQLADNSPSPMGRWLNGTLVAAETDSLTIHFTVRGELCNPMGMLHGGAAAAILDEILGMTVYASGVDHFYTSVNLNVDFLFSAPKGSLLTIKSQIARKGKKIIHVEACITDEQGQLIAKATSNLVATSQPAK